MIKVSEVTYVRKAVTHAFAHKGVQIVQVSIFRVLGSGQMDEEDTGSKA